MSLVKNQINHKPKYNIVKVSNLVKHLLIQIFFSHWKNSMKLNNAVCIISQRIRRELLELITLEQINQTKSVLATHLFSRAASWVRLPSAFAQRDPQCTPRSNPQSACATAAGVQRCHSPGRVYSKGQWKADVGFLTAHPTLVLTRAALSSVRICSWPTLSFLKKILFSWGDCQKLTFCRSLANFTIIKCTLPLDALALIWALLKFPYDCNTTRFYSPTFLGGW